MKKGIWSLIGLLVFLCGIFANNQAAARLQDQSQKQFPFLARVERKSVNIRAGQDVNFERIASLKKKEQVVVVDQSYSWYKIKLPVRADSYISRNFVKILRGGVGQITGSRVNIRARRSVNSSIIGQLRKGALVQVLRESEDWYKIEPPDQSHGWVLAEYVSFQSRDIPPARFVSLPQEDKQEDKEEKKRRVIQDFKARSLKKVMDKAKEIAKKKSNRVSGQGIIKDLGRKALSKDIRHKFVVDGKTVYFLQGHRRIIDGFLNHAVTIEGKIQQDVKSKYPVLLVTRINLVL